MRIVSLLPAATEMLCAMDAEASLVGVSHECDYPSSVAGLPSLTRSRLEFDNLSSRIHESVTALVEHALSIYEVDVECMKGLDPDLVITQDLCDVCAVSYDDVCAAVGELAGRARVITLHPARLGDLYRDIREIGEAAGFAEPAGKLVDRLQTRMRELGERTRMLPEKSVLLLEWLQPAMIGGLWSSDLATAAGTRALASMPGEHARTLGRDELAALDPDVVVIKPCGFKLPQTIEELPRFPEYLPWTEWRAARSGRVYLVDGNAYFNRSGPRLVDSAELLAACAHPAVFDDFRSRYTADVRRVLPDLTLGAFDD